MAKRIRKAPPTKVTVAIASASRPVNEDVAAGRKQVEVVLAAMTQEERERLRQQQQIIIGSPVGTTIPWVPIAIGNAGPIRPPEQVKLLREIRDALTAAAEPATPQSRSRNSRGGRPRLYDYAGIRRDINSGMSDGDVQLRHNIHGASNWRQVKRRAMKPMKRDRTKRK